MSPYFFSFSFQYSYDLLLQYLHKSQSITMLGIINEHINFQGAVPSSCWFFISVAAFLFALTSPFVHFFFSRGHNKLMVRFTVTPGQPSSIADDSEYVTLFGSDQDAANLINQKEIHWGVSQQQNRHIYCVFSLYTFFLNLDMKFTELSFPFRYIQSECSRSSCLYF